MKLLGVETSSGTFSVAVSDDEKILAFLQAQGIGRPSTGLTPLMEQALQETGWNFPDLDGFALSIGPGSFTGLRVGVTMVKTLAWALKKPVVPVSTLEIIAENLLKTDREILLFLDARKGKVYTARFRSNGTDFVQRLSEDQLLLPEETLKTVTRPTVLLGDGTLRYEQLLTPFGPEKLTVAEPSAWIPRADVLCRLAHRDFETSRVDDPHRLVPQYLYSKKSDITGW